MFEYPFDQTVGGYPPPHTHASRFTEIRRIELAHRVATQRQEKLRENAEICLGAKKLKENLEKEEAKFIREGTPYIEVRVWRDEVDVSIIAR